MNREPKKLRFPSGPDRILEAGIKLLDRFWDRSQYEIGGGTVLAARWHHRHSTDVDCFMNVDTFRSTYERNTSDLEEALSRIEEEGLLTSRSVDSRMLTMKFADLGEMSLISGHSLTRSPETSQFEETTEIRLEPTAEILAKKLAFRVVEGRWKQRDFFDLVVASKCDPDAYQVAMDVLSEGERTSIAQVLREQIGRSTLEMGMIEDPFDSNVADTTWELAADLFEGREIDLPSLQGRRSDKGRDQGLDRDDDFDFGL